MRPIKFRAWDIEQKRLAYNAQNVYDAPYVNVTDAAGNSLDAYSPYVQCFGGFLENERFVVEQFTGLLDKNGKEIYEGDIVAGVYGVNWEIRYKAPEWQLYRNENGGRSGTGDHTLWRVLEVIGNIHETPDLLR